ncbi:MAG TPA: serine/threonine-protein kinase [Kofleriaceae bacterium]|nr:serine/threonine-protein kinase [Kofleriaceae bacterium]
MPTKPGRAAPQIRNALDDTLRLEPPAEPGGAAATRSLPADERYRLGAELGRGGMGRVVEAFDLQLGRTVALKEVLPRGGPGIAKRFAREVQLTARLEHPSIIPLYDSGTTIDGRPFYVMRRVSGRPLDQLMAKAADLGERLTHLPALLAAIDAVAHAHRRGVIHRDLKPANILVGELGETVVIDWGLAKVIGEDDDKPGTVIATASDSLRTQIGSVFGTPGFMAPEQARGEELDPRGDVYALGAILYQLLAGAPPHAGTSATEVIEKTGSREVTPVDVVAPGAPADLVAIVGKALAFDPAGRYPDAGALGEDVRRFLAGQLVAAHRYTSRQRLARFARRHRAPLSVAALAMVSVAVLAWVGVHRIVRERDAANEAREQAAAGRAAAERAVSELRRSADQLLVLQAGSLLDGNPTHAAAVLKEVPEGSERLGDARAAAQAAAVRGVAWTMQTPDVVTVFAELSPDGKFFVQSTRDGVVRVWDLDRRRQVIARPYPHGTRARWAGKLVFVFPDKAAPQLLDPFTATTVDLPIGPVTDVHVTTSGGAIAYLDDHAEAHLLDVAARAARPLWPGHRVQELELAPDGAWIALADDAAVVVLDPTGRELTRRPGKAVRMFGSASGELGVLFGDKVVTCALAPAPAWAPIDLAGFAPGLPFDFVYRGHELDIFLSTGKVAAWNGKQLRERLRLDGMTPPMVVAGSDLLVVAGNDGKLHFASELVTGELHLPTPLRTPRAYGRPGVPRVVVLGHGLLVGFDLAEVIPERIAVPPGAHAAFVDDDTLLLWQSPGGQWQWYDVRTRAATSFTYDPRGIPLIAEIDPSDGRVLVEEIGNDSTLLLLRKGKPEQKRLVHGANVWVRLLPHGALLLGVGDGRLLAVTDDAPPREIAKLEGIAQSGVGLGGARYAAVSSIGELVRGDLATGALERAHVSPGMRGLVAAARAGSVLVAEDDRLYLWDRDLVELARLHQQITRIVPVDDGALLELADRSMVRAALTPGAPVMLVVAGANQGPLVSDDGRLVVGQTVNDQALVFETATRATWNLPAYSASFQLMAISPSTRRLVQAGFGQLALWTLPLAGGELRPWLDERTNAVTDRDHRLIWQWPPPSP